MDFLSDNEYKDFLDILANIVIYSDQNSKSIEYLIDYDNFIKFVLKHFPEVF
jgi:hypothetical protein